MLHIFSKSSVEPRMLDRVDAGDSILFIRSAVFALMSGNILQKQLKIMVKQNRIFVLSSDLVARGVLPEELLDGIGIINYEGFVELTVGNSVIQSWG